MQKALALVCEDVGMIENSQETGQSGCPWYIIIRLYHIFHNLPTLHQDQQKKYTGLLISMGLHFLRVDKTCIKSIHIYFSSYSSFFIWVSVMNLQYIRKYFFPLMLWRTQEDAMALEISYWDELCDTWERLLTEFYK